MTNHDDQPNESLDCVLNLPKQVPAPINPAKGIVRSMTGNATFPVPEPTLAAVNATLAEKT